MPLKGWSTGPSLRPPVPRVRQEITLQQGIPIEKARDIVKMIKDSKKKVQASIQGDFVRVAGKDRDTLQEVMALLRGQRFRHRHAVHQLPDQLDVPMPRKIESLVSGRSGRDAWKRCSKSPKTAQPREAALVCHPHPQHGGTMHNKVVYRIARGLRRAGHVVLRFNYRGVNLSEGELRARRRRTGRRARGAGLSARPLSRLPFTLAGFSFGSRIALRLGCDAAGSEPRRVIAVGFPTVYRDRSYLEGCTVARTFVQSSNDEFGPVRPGSRGRGAPRAQAAGPRRSADHFFAGALGSLRNRKSRLYPKAARPIRRQPNNPASAAPASPKVAGSGVCGVSGGSTAVACRPTHKSWNESSHSGV